MSDSKSRSSKSQTSKSSSDYEVETNFITLDKREDVEIENELYVLELELESTVLYPKHIMLSSSFVLNNNPEAIPLSVSDMPMYFSASQEKETTSSCLSSNKKNKE